MFGIVRKVASAVAIGAVAMGTAFAASDLGNPPPLSAIVSHAGLEWVWASPCEGIPDAVCGGGNGGVVLHDGFHFASAAEWATWADLATFQAAWANVTCASPQFSVSFDHCDAGDLAGGYVWDSPLTDAAKARNTNSETFLVRSVPEPESLALLALAFGLMGFVARRGRA
jgi:hypothetical protein